MSTRLSKVQLDQYTRAGIVFPIKVFSADEAAYFRAALEAVADHPGVGTLKRLDNLHLFFAWAYRLVTHDALLNAVEDLLGSELVVCGSLVFLKPPQDSSYVSWHQDSVYSGLHLTPSVSAWIALTASHPANGCMRVIPGSHTQGLLDHASTREASNLLLRGERVALPVDESRALDVVLQPGEMSLHHSTVIHGSNANISGEPRIGFIVRFATHRITNRKIPMLRARGHADCGHLILAEPPLPMDSQSAFAAWRAFSGASRPATLDDWSSTRLNRREPG